MFIIYKTKRIYMYKKCINYETKCTWSESALFTKLRVVCCLESVLTIKIDVHALDFINLKTKCVCIEFVYCLLFVYRKFFD